MNGDQKFPQIYQLIKNTLKSKLRVDNVNNSSDSILKINFSRGAVELSVDYNVIPLQQFVNMNVIESFYGFAEQIQGQDVSEANQFAQEINVSTFVPQFLEENQNIAIKSEFIYGPFEQPFLNNFNDLLLWGIYVLSQNETICNFPVVNFITDGQFVMPIELYNSNLEKTGEICFILNNF